MQHFEWLVICLQCPKSYLPFSVPRPSVLRILALALTFLLPSVCKFAQQRLCGGCRERKMKVRDMLEGQHLVTLQKGKCPVKPHRLLSTSATTFLSLAHSLPLPCHPMKLLDKFPGWQCWQALCVLAPAGSPWKSIAGYCWNNNHSNCACKYLLDGNARPLCQPKLFF